MYRGWPKSWRVWPLAGPGWPKSCRGGWAGSGARRPVCGGVAAVPVADRRTVGPGDVAAAGRVSPGGVGPGGVGPGHARVASSVRGVGLRAGGGPLARVLDDDRGDLFLG